MSGEKCAFRAVWVATVRNLDFEVSPEKKLFKSRFSQVADSLADRNMNAVIFQVRPMLDAFYPSAINPWSEFLTGKQGTGIQGDWNPLALMIEEAHERGLEFHAWFNPYRVTGTRYTDSTFADHTLEQLDAMPVPQLLSLYAAHGILASSNFAVQHPRLVYRHDRLLYLDAGFPEVRKHIVDTVMEVVQNHDVDGIHFDDYFYPYNVSVAEMAELTKTTFDRHSAGFSDTPEGWGGWLRHNNDEMIRSVHEAIRAENAKSGRAVQFGVSPFGIWWNNLNHPAGSPTGDTTFTFTGGVYADTRKWVLEEWIDYIVPQIYWERDHPAAPYAPLVRWWADLVDGKNVHLYIGHGNYKHAAAPFCDLAAWRNPREILEQVAYCSKYPSVKGNVFFAFNHVNRIEETEPGDRVLVDSNNLLREYWREHLPTTPAKPWLLAVSPAEPPVVGSGN